MTVNQERIKSLILAIVPLIIAVFIMLPRLISPQFGLFDDGSMLVEVNRLIEHDWSMVRDIHAGRFRPTYWLYFLFIFAFAGPTPFWFFFGHLVLFLIILIEIRILMQQMGASNWQILITSLIFIFSIPIIENFYTLSKGEPLQLAFVLGSIIFLSEIKAPVSKIPRWASALGAFISILLALMVKETTMIILPIAIACLGFILLKEKSKLHGYRGAYLVFTGLAIAAIITYFILRNHWGATTLTGGGYTKKYSFTFQSISIQFLRWTTLLAHYFHYLIPLGIMALLSQLKIETNDRQQLDLFFWAVWVGSWIVVLLPWEYAKAYYLLPFSLGISILIGLTFPQIITMISRAKNICRSILISGLVLAAILFLSTLSHYHTHARIQLIFDKMNSQMLAHTSQNLPTNKAVFVNFETEKEYVNGIELLLKEQYHLTDIVYDNMSPETLGLARWIPEGIVLMPHVLNKPEVIVRAGVDNVFVQAWNDIVYRELQDRLVLISSIKERMRLNNLNLPVLLCPLVGKRGFCENPDPLFDTRFFEYGWEIYQLQ